MIYEVDRVRTAEGNEWEYTLPRPESLQEAIELYGEQGVYRIFWAGLKLRLQNLARDAFRMGKSREVVEETLRNYRPGRARKSMKRQALEAITANAARLERDSDLQKRVMDAFVGRRFKAVLELLAGEEERS